MSCEQISFDDDFFERLIGFSIPENDNELLAISYEGIHILIIDNAQINTDLNYPEGGDIYNWKDGTIVYKNNKWRVIGLFKETSIIINRYDEQISIQNKECMNYVMNITCKSDVIFTHEFEDFSGDWRCATFSESGNLVVLGAPYLLRIFRRDHSNK
jgi:hypothetical protein